MIMVEEQLPVTTLEIANYLKENAAKKKSRKAELTDFFLSLFAFIAFGQAFYSGPGVLGLACILFLHELGHFLGMKAFACQNTQIRFVPFLGAYTSGLESNPNTAQRVMVALSGPCPGILIGFILWKISLVSGNDNYSQLAKLFLLINGFNLLPFLPLDGGRVIEDLFFARHRKLQGWFQWLMFCFLIFLSIRYHSLWVGILAAVLFFQNNLLGPIAQISEDVKNWAPPDEKALSLKEPPPRYIKLIVDKLEHKTWFRGFQSKKNLGAQAYFVKSIWQRMRNQYPSKKVAVLLLAVYALFLLSVLPILKVYGIELIPTTAQNIKITEKQAVKISEKEAQSLGYSLDNMSVKTSQHKQPWNLYLPKDSTGEYSRIRKEKLKEKQYWAVYFSSKNPLQRGGDVCIFIDAQTGEVLTNYRGK